MQEVKVIKIGDESIEFDDGSVLESNHESDCCEYHWLSFKDLKLSDFEGLTFDLSDESFFERVEDYGIRLLPINNHPVSVPGYGSNNGYYSSNLSLLLNTPGGKERSFDISECQDPRQDNCLV